MPYLKAVPAMLGLVTLAAVACTGGSIPNATPAAQPETEPVAAQPAPTPQVTATAAAQPTPATQASATPTVEQPTPMPEATATPTPALPTPTTEATAEPTSTPVPAAQLPEEPQLSTYMTFGWKTDFSKHSVPLNEIISGGPRRDGIPPIDNPKFLEVADPPDYMVDDEPVISLELNGEAKAYPLTILMSHEIVNDDVGGVPVSVTYCPLCNTAIVFDRRVDGAVLDFGTSGNLRNSDLVMWDRQTESWWQQITGEAIVGELTGTKLTFIPAPVISWAQFYSAFPHGKLLSRDTGFSINYNRTPYYGYDEAYNYPFLFTGLADKRLPLIERVVGITVENQQIAYPFSVLQDNPVVNDSIGGQEFVVLYVGGTLSPFIGDNLTKRPVGSTAVYEPFVNGQKLTFEVQEDVIVDRETGSRWNILGQAVEGPLEGDQLAPVLHGNHFWFAWAAFNPDTEIWSP